MGDTGDVRAEMTASLFPFTVRFEASGAEREVKGGCFRCGVTPEDVRDLAVVVSPRGIAHFGMDGGDTKCGIDATGENWWWPL